MIAWVLIAMVSPLATPQDYLCVTPGSNAAAIVHGVIAGPGGDYGVMREEDRMFIAEAVAERNLAAPGHAEPGSFHLMERQPFLLSITPTYVPMDLTPADGSYLEPPPHTVSNLVVTGTTWLERVVATVPDFERRPNAYRADWPMMLVPTNRVATNWIAHAVETPRYLERAAEFKDSVLKSQGRFVAAASIWANDPIELGEWPSMDEVTNIYARLARPHRLLVGDPIGRMYPESGAMVTHTRWEYYNDNGSGSQDYSYVTNAATWAEGMIWSASAYRIVRNQQSSRSFGQSYTRRIVDTEDTLYINLPDSVTNLTYAGGGVELAALFVRFLVRHRVGENNFETNLIMRVDGAAVENHPADMTVRVVFPFIDPYYVAARAVSLAGWNYPNYTDIKVNDLPWPSGDGSISRSAETRIEHNGYEALLDCTFRTDLSTGNKRTVKGGSTNE